LGVSVVSYASQRYFRRKIKRICLKRESTTFC
jgi:hypothetical protein